MFKKWKAMNKRIKVTKNKKLLRKSAGQNHFNTRKRSKTVLGKRGLMTMDRNLKIKNLI
jgi:ribosomal protein L35